MSRMVFRVSSGAVNQTVRSEREVVTLGRAQGCTIALDDTALSRTHCQFERLGSAVYVRDLNSRNGTRVNGEVVNRLRLEPGSTVEVGSTAVIFEGLEEGVSQGLAARTLQLFAKPRPPRARREELEGQNQRLIQLLSITRQLVEDLKPDRVLSRIIDTAVDLASAERGFLLVFHGKDLVVEIARNYWRKDVDGPEFEVSRHIAEQVRQERRSLIVEDATEDERFSEFLSVHALKLRSVLCVPLLFRSTVEGVLYLDNRFGRAAFREEDRGLIESFADLAAIALVNSGRFEAIRRKKRDLEEEVAQNRRDLAAMQEVLAKTQGEHTLRYSYDQIVAESPAMRDVVRLVDRVTPTDLPVLLEGASGTGKERLARIIHANGPRASGPFVALTCAALPISLAEVELFGHGRGAFTGALEARGGLLDEADRGTLYLEGIDDLELESQALFLRVFETGEYRRVGDHELRRANVRFMAGSRRPLEELVKRGEFREDFYFRLRAVRIGLPSIAERPEDLPRLLEDLLREEAPRLKITPRARKALLIRPWPGNVLELRNEIRRLSTLGDVTADVSELSSADLVSGVRLKDEVERLEKRLIVRALQVHAGNLTRAARELGLSRLGLRKKLERYELARRRADR